MKKILITLIFSLCAFFAHAQNLQSLGGYGHKFDRLAANKFFRPPVYADTSAVDLVVNLNNGDTIGAIIYRLTDNELYVKRPTGWGKIGGSSPIPSWQQVTGVGNSTSNKVTITGATAPGSPDITGLTLRYDGPSGGGTIESYDYNDFVYKPLWLRGSAINIGSPGTTTNISGTLATFPRSIVGATLDDGSSFFQVGGNGRFEGTVKGFNATASNEFITRGQMTDSLNGRGAGVIPSWQQVSTAGNTTDRFLRVTGVNGVTGSGPGLELFYFDATSGAVLQSWDRTANLFKPMTIGSSVTNHQGRLLVNGATDDGTSALQVNGRLKSFDDSYFMHQGADNGIGIQPSLSYPNIQAQDFAGGIPKTLNLQYYGGGVVVGNQTYDGSSGLQVAGVTKASRFISTAANGLQMLNSAAHIEAYNDAVTQRHGYLQWDGANSATGLFNDLAWPLIFGTSGTERMRIHSNGFVGINTSNVYNPISLPNNKYIGWNRVDGTNDDAGIKADASNNLVFYSGTGERMYIKAATGRVGIGEENPASRLHVNGVVTADAVQSQAGGELLLYAQGASSGAVGRWTTQGLGIGGLPGGSHSEKLLVTGNAVSTDAWIIDNPGSAVKGEFFDDGGSALGIRSITNHPFNLYTNNTLRTTMRAGGGIKTHTGVAGATRIVSTASPYTVGVDDHIILMSGMGTGEGGGVLITLPDPAAAENDGRELIFIEQSASTWVSSQLLYTAMSSTTQINGMTTVRCIGGKWFITAKITSSFP